MILLENLISPVQNCEETSFYLCKALDVSITKTTLVNTLLEHPHYPSLLSISDILQKYGISNVSLKLKDPKKIFELTSPFIAQITGEKTHSSLFAVIYHVTSTEVEWRNPETHKKEIISYERFKKQFTNYVQVYDVAETNSGEKEYVINTKKERLTRFINNALALSIPMFTLIMSIVAFIINGVDAVFSVLFMFVTLAGVIAGALIVLLEIDQFNPALQKVCTGGKKTNCAAILHSKGSKIFGIHWSIIGFSYFMGMLAILLAGGLFNLQLLTVAAWINVLVLPYTVYSIFYQARIVKQWCPMCLVVQVVLVLLFIISLAGGFLSTVSLSVLLVVPYITSIGLVFIAVYLLLPALKKAKASKHYQQRLQRLKHNPQIIETLLVKQKKIKESTEGLGITLGNPAGKIHLVKVCNPYCGPCAQAHPVIDELLATNPEIKLQIIFTVTDLDEDYQNKPVKTLLALYQDKHFPIEKALDKWYLASKKDYNEFEKTYTFTQDNLNKQKPAIKAMHEWCEKTNIEFTPTFFINNHQLPNIYSVADLRYFLSV